MASLHNDLGGNCGAQYPSLTSAYEIQYRFTYPDAFKSVNQDNFTATRPEAKELMHEIRGHCVTFQIFQLSRRREEKAAAPLLSAANTGGMIRKLAQQIATQAVRSKSGTQGTSAPTSQPVMANAIGGQQGQSPAGAGPQTNVASGIASLPHSDVENKSDKI
ncbi:hypothetical protein R1sor_001575 [Riccia sorocarpa]|uniref:Uncharacterized protein n=1 Tax=Riccia sorocarpa TaxID=122646 RepID=A0ABD3GWC7_9MARC